MNQWKITSLVSLVAILSLSVVAEWQFFNLQNQIANLTLEVTTFKNEVTNLRSEVTTLYLEAINSTSNIANLTSEIEELKTPQLKPDFKIQIYEEGMNYTKFDITNIGSVVAHDVIILTEHSNGLFNGVIIPIIKNDETYLVTTFSPIDKLNSVWVTCREGVSVVLYL